MTTRDTLDAVNWTIFGLRTLILVGGIVFAIVVWRRATRAAVLTVVACALTIVAMVVSTTVPSWIDGVEGLIALNAVASVLTIVGLALFIVAALAGRGPATPRPPHGYGAFPPPGPPTGGFPAQPQGWPPPGVPQQPPYRQQPPYPPQPSYPQQQPPSLWQPPRPPPSST